MLFNLSHAGLNNLSKTYFIVDTTPCLRRCPIARVCNYPYKSSEGISFILFLSILFSIAKNEVIPI